jgi:hypothetical protein
LRKNGKDLEKRDKMEKIYNVQRIEFTGHEMILKVNEQEFIFPLENISKKLLNASRTARETFDISPSGYGIHWPVIDEDLSVAGLLKTKNGLGLF